MNTSTLVTTALVGTARQEQGESNTGTPIDAFVSALAGQEIERSLLLKAGAWAIYRQAGDVATHLAETPEPAPIEKLAVCSPTVAALLRNMFLGERDFLLPEALDYLRKANARLPYDLLPVALAVRTKSLQSAVFPTLGERGMWLSRFNPEWDWTKHFLPAPPISNSLPQETERIWLEGTIGQRCQILSGLRAIDPAQARAWLEAVWKQEKAEARLELLKTFEIGLSIEDEPFLEKALDDRAPSVKAYIPTLLARIPDSAFAQRMLSRADTSLTYARGKLKIALPTTFDKAWLRDGISEKPPTGLGERSWWLMQLFTRVPLTHWEEQFHLTPAELIELAGADRFGNTIVEGWSRAAQLFAARHWSEPLWDWWHRQQKKKKLSGTTTSDMRDELIQHMAAQRAEHKLQQLMEDYTQPESAGWEDLLGGLPTPWSVEFGAAYLQFLRLHLDTLQLDTNNAHPYADSWFQSLETAATRLPSSCFTAASEAWPLLKGNDWQTEQWQQHFADFIETLRIRQRLLEEMAQ